MDGFYRLTFSDINSEGYQWAGEWVSKDETVVFPTWKISCTKRESKADAPEKQKILATAKNFSKAYMEADYDGMAAIYTEDGKIFPNNSRIIEGKEAIKQRWVLPEGVQIMDHKTTTEEINIIGNYAYDYGYYKGSSKSTDGTISDWQGKYVIVWKKVGPDWKMYLDIWNRVAD